LLQRQQVRKDCQRQVWGVPQALHRCVDEACVAQILQANQGYWQRRTFVLCVWIAHTLCRTLTSDFGPDSKAAEGPAGDTFGRIWRFGALRTLCC
jgi:hypothetical protein